MFKISLYFIVLSLLFAACADDNYATGTVDPNANPIALNSSSSEEPGPTISPDVSSSSDYGNAKTVVKADERIMVVYSLDGKMESCIDTLYSLGFKTSVTKSYAIVSTDKGAISADKGEIAVYAQEKGATASCEVDGKSYSSKFKFGQNDRVERTIKLEKYGTACESVFEQFKSLCLLQDVNDELSGACDADGSLEAYCAYVDKNADFDQYLVEYTAESKANCGEEGLRMESFGI